MTDASAREKLTENRMWKVIVLAIGIILAWAINNTDARISSTESLASENATRLTAIEANRFTSSDALKIQATLMREIASLWNEIADAKARMVRVETLLDEED